MEVLNHRLFMLLNAPAHPSELMLLLARGAAEDLILLVPLLLVYGWLWGNEQRRIVMLEATATGSLGLLANQVIAFFWLHPRPFMVAMGHTFLHHAADSSFPSDHLTLIWGVSCSLMMRKRFRRAGIALAVAGVPVAWARIYLGVHFPFDMAGAALVALMSAWLVFRSERLLIAVCYRPMLAAYHLIAKPLIQGGWVDE
ncbi:undecaprenyl-diphosphatase [Geobacter hydrogenophilus]|nr:undecaprenyl-diphosphatase [Geobacter hydrogenophilus]MBT0892807.1 undecaprenyl-diphosphatase [Geobacter hydrogenophilus]